MAEIRDILRFMREFAPEEMTEPDFIDSVGLMVGSENGRTDKCMVCLDATESAVMETADAGAKLLISHHPVIFRGISSVTDETPAGRTILKASSRGVAIYSAHTNLDFCDGGLNDYAAKLLGLDDIRPMKVVNGIKIGRIGRLEEEKPLHEFEKAVRIAFGDDQIRAVGDKNRKIRTVAILNGGGGNEEYVELAESLGADCFVSADFSHHALLRAKEDNFSVLSMQHFAMESVYMVELCRILSGAFPDVSFVACAEESPTHKGA